MENGADQTALASIKARTNKDNVLICTPVINGIVTGNAGKRANDKVYQLSKTLSLLVDV